MAKKQEEKAYVPGNVIYAQHNKFYDELFLNHSDLIKRSWDLDERNLGSYVDMMKYFLAGYNPYIPNHQEIKKKLKKVRAKTLEKEYLELVFDVMNQGGPYNLNQDDFIKYKEKVTGIKDSLIDIFEDIIKGLPSKNIFPQETANEDYEDSDHFT